MLTKTLIDEAMNIPGSYTAQNMLALYTCSISLVSAPSIVVEIGVDQGRSARILIEALRGRGKLVLVDSWRGLDDNRIKVEQLIAHTNSKDFVEILHMESIEAARLYDHNSLSLIHIDADHWNGSPDKDCAVWLPLLRSGGYACFHDYGAIGMPEVKTAVDYHTNGWCSMGDWEGLAIRRKL